MHFENVISSKHEGSIGLVEQQTERNAICQHCGVTMNTMSKKKLTKHIEGRHELTSKCSTYSKELEIIILLNKHVKRVHWRKTQL